MRLTVYQNGNEETVFAEKGQTLMDALHKAGIRGTDAPCGGNGKCGKCLVRAQGDISPADIGEKELLAGREHYRLACLAKVEGDCTLYLEDEIPAVAVSGGILYDIMREADFRQGIGAAVDIGTTTVVLYIVDLETGKILNTQSGVNSQRAFGADVISRVQYTIENSDGLTRLTETIRRQIGEYLKLACAELGREIDEVREIAIAGNTIMEHIFAGLPPETIALAPFTPVSLFGECFSAGSMGLPPSNAPVYLAPCVAGYVGGDITAGLLASGAYRAEKPFIFLDIGTNGEAVLGTKDGFLCCATAAGPAFEGAEITCGMSAVSGAVSRVWLEDGEVRFLVIGGGDPKGICGSGLVDILAMLLDLGAADETGRLLPADEAPAGAYPYLGKKDSRIIFYLDKVHAIFVTDSDVRKLQLAKAAVAAGIKTLLSEAGLREADVDTVYLAGGFGNYIDKNSAAAIGLIPDALVQKLVPVGNSAGMGAVASLLSEKTRERLDMIRDKCSYLELSNSRVFNDYYIECMSFE